MDTDKTTPALTIYSHQNAATELVAAALKFHEANIKRLNDMGQEVAYIKDLVKGLQETVQKQKA